MKPILPKGVRDFLPHQVYQRSYIFNTIRSIYQKYGYLPIETPTIESLSTLTGKYGDEGDRLLFKILNNGDYLKNADEKTLQTKNSQQLTSQISKRGLRYDLTVPFARYVAMNQNELHFPFKRYQIQPVWRADRPQKGRYNEFYQCDADVVGSDSLIYEAELMQIFDEVFDTLRLPVTININHRKILSGLVEKIGLIDEAAKIITIIDKFDKVGIDGVIEIFSKENYTQSQLEIISTYLSITTIQEINELLSGTIAQDGINELNQVYALLNKYTFKNEFKFNPQLARGLDYYTGCIFEVTDPKQEIGSLGGGGRYADLAAVFGFKNMSGVGLSFGAERIYLLMNQRGLFPNLDEGRHQILLMCDHLEGLQMTFDLMTSLRQSGISAVMYPDASKLKKQFKYAEQIKPIYTLVIGKKELDSGLFTLKKASDQTDHVLSLEAIVDFFSDS